MSEPRFALGDIVRLKSNQLVQFTVVEIYPAATNDGEEQIQVGYIANGLLETSGALPVDAFEKVERT